MNIQMIPLNKLVPSPANVRKTGPLLGIEELAASIKAHGLLQNLQCVPATKENLRWPPRGAQAPRQGEGPR